MLAFSWYLGHSSWGLVPYVDSDGQGCSVRVILARASSGSVCYSHVGRILASWLVQEGWNQNINDASLRATGNFVFPVI